MDKPEVTAVFDIGKTNKKILLFDNQLKVIFQKEEKFNSIKDDDGFECDDIKLIELWIVSTLFHLIGGNEFKVKAVNFATYGASLAFLDANGRRLTPIYSYLKEIDPDIQLNLFNKYGGETEFCCRTASPALGLLLNSGLQILWLKQEKPEVYKKVESILHFPQYLSYLLTKEIISESTSIGCHTFLWDFDNNQYHHWLKDESIVLPAPLPNTHIISTSLNGQDLNVGIGIHDSSASLVPYIKASKENFLLVSTGTWCINMNPFNHTPLTEKQLQSDCLSYISIDRQAVKSSRLFMGHIHDVNVARLAEYFGEADNSYKKVRPNRDLLIEYLSGEPEDKLFFKEGVPANYVDDAIELSQFKSFTEAYHRLMFDLTLLNTEAINLVLIENDGVEQIYISGGFARNELFVSLMASLYPHMKVFTSEVDNSSALGAALVISDTDGSNIDLGLKLWLPLV